MWICFMLFGAVLSALADEFGGLGHQGEFTFKDVDSLKQIIPGFITGASGSKYDFSHFFPKDNDLYTAFNNYVEKDVTKKGLTFNIYDDDMRNATIALYRLLKDIQKTDKANFDKVKEWAKYNINNDILDYALRLASLFNSPESGEKFLPPFIKKPNYFVSGDTIMKAFYYRVNKDSIKEDLKKMYQILNDDDNTVVINSNYSSCNIPLQACDAQLKYFGEDVALNSYYYGLHLLHPFWMTDDELSVVNPKHASHYYFAHQQLYARYLLEKEHIDPDANSFESKVEPDFLPYLYYENGLSFPTRTSILGRKIRKDVTYLQTIDIAITECIRRGIVQVENGTIISMTEENYMDLLAKFLRSQVDSPKVAKVIRSVFGYATNGYPVDKYNPAPSVMHHSQTSLRDPVYWYLIKRVVDYLMLYTNNTEHYDISKYETDDFTIRNIEVSKISTIYEYYLINLENSLTGGISVHNSNTKVEVFARQKRLNHKPFVVNFSVDSNTEKYVIIRLFLGPLCSVTDCWEMHSKFFQLDCYRYKLDEGSNNLTWTPHTSLRYSSDHSFNKSKDFENAEENYNIFKFPKNLVIPKGREDGLNLTMFIMILDEEENYSDSNFSTLYMQVTNEISNKPLGFPFHKQVDVTRVKYNAANYRFLNITVFHIKNSTDNTGYFSSYLY